MKSKRVMRSYPTVVKNNADKFGPGLQQVLENEAGDFIDVKPGVPHEVFNMSDTEPVVAFVGHSSADEWDDIVPCDRNQQG